MAECGPLAPEISGCLQRAHDPCEAGDSPALRVRTAGRAFGGQGRRGPAEWDSPGAGRGRGSAERAIRGSDTANNK